MHNGALSHHSERRPALLDSLRPEVRELIQGETDSELLFALITNALPREKLFGEASSERSAELISQAELVAAVEATIGE
jgi:predicted glutamine amidotransferase